MSNFNKSEHFWGSKKAFEILANLGLEPLPETSPMSMDRMSRDFVSKISMPEDLDDCTYVVPIDAIVHPLCVFKNYGGPNREYFCILPQRKWGRYFGDKIIMD